MTEGNKVEINADLVYIKDTGETQVKVNFSAPEMVLTAVGTYQLGMLLLTKSYEAVGNIDMIGLLTHMGKSVEDGIEILEEYRKRLKEASKVPPSEAA